MTAPSPDLAARRDADPAQPLLAVRGLTVSYGAGSQAVRAVRGVDFELQRGQTLGMAGESGCGKTTVALSLLRLLPPTARIGGEVLFKGENVVQLGWQRLRAVRWAEASVVFQGAMSALNPVRTIGEQICEPILLHEKTGRREASARAAELLRSVGVPPARQGSYPHELSGGQRQRVMIAMALACEPDLIIADEPTTALDVIVQAQILSLLTRLVAERQIGMIVISHDLSVLAETCERLAIMYAGQIAEIGPARQLLAHARHPYTRILSRAFPRTGDPASRLAPAGLPGEPPDLRTAIRGCPFAPRCPEVIEACRTAEIELWPAGTGRQSACLRADYLAEQDITRQDDSGNGQSASAAAAEAAVAEENDQAEPAVNAGAAETVSAPRGPADASAVKASTADTQAAALAARDLRIVFPSRRGRPPARAVDEVNLAIAPGEIVALIGESGCGKSSLARALVGLIRPDGGDVLVDGEPLKYSGAALKEHRRRVQLVLQDPAGALNPKQNVFDAVAEGPRVHGLRDGLTARVHQALSRAGLRPPEQFIARYPHELSGGQQQRVVIAGALALSPSVIVADEPVSSLDASVRGEILRLILDLRDQLGLSALIVSHDLGVAWNIADRVAVMYLGRIVEIGTVSEVLLNPRHPYTRALISVLPDAHRPPGAEEYAGLSGEPADSAAIPAGCRFHPRCPRYAALDPADQRRELCQGTAVPVLAASAPVSLVACHLVAADEASEPRPAAEAR